MSNTDNKRIEHQLQKALESARKRYEQRKGSLDDYVTALRRFTDYVMHGTVPQDFSNSEKRRRLFEDLRNDKPE